MKSVELTPSKRGRILQCRDDKISVRGISEKLGIPKSTVQNTINREDRYHTRNSLPRSGRPKKYSIRDERKLVREMLRDRFVSFQAIAASNHMSTRSVREIAKRHGLAKRVARRKPFINKRNQLKRKAWASENTDKDWSNVIFTDEAAFEIGEDVRRSWVTRGVGEEFNEACVEPTFKSSRRSLMVWGAIAYNKKWPLFRLPLNPSVSDGKTRTKAETLNSQRYAEWVVRGPIKQYSDELSQELGRQAVVVEDGASPHKSKIAQMAREELGIQQLIHPPSSPDLNAIEPMWYNCKCKVASFCPIASNLDMLWEQIEQAWNDIPQKFINDQIERMSDRVKAVKESKGKATPF